MQSGDLYIWDSHFSPNEGKTKLETLINKPNLVLLHNFKPDVKFAVIGGVNYEIGVFKKK
jgi:hypothetical protein